MALTLTHVVQLVLFSSLLTCGQILFKLSASSVPTLGSVAGFLGLVTNIWFWGAIVLYGCSTLLWIMILQKTPLSLAYPFVALGFVFVPMISWYFFKEPLNVYYITGVLMILSGLAFITVLGSK